MGILGIENRTENWKTVQHFYGLGEDAKVRLVRRLLREPQFQPDHVKVELFWKGMRDYLGQLKRENEDIPTAQQLAECYASQFGELRESVANFRAPKHPHTFQTLKPHNYDASDQNHTVLFNNLRDTEIDIVLQSSGYLFIGEAKHESKFGGEGKLILVHQLIRQYVMAKILVRLMKRRLKVIPFVVGDLENLASTKNTVQVKFMVEQGRMKDGWLKEENVLSWERIKRLSGVGP